MPWFCGRTLIYLLCFLILPSSIFAAVDENQGWTLVDGIVALIEKVPVLRSDVQLEADFGLLGEPDENAGFQGLLEAYLNRLLILKELEDIGGFRLMEGQAEGAFEGYLEGFKDEAEFENKLAKWGVDEGEIYKRLQRALLATLYTESRIMFLVKVVPSDIEKAYAENPERWDGIGLFEAWETIKSELLDQSFEREKKRWLDTLRERYDLVMVQRDKETM